MSFEDPSPEPVPGGRRKAGEDTPRIKGVAVISVVGFLRGRKERSRELLPARLHGYLDRKLLASSWFPEADFRDLLKGLSRLVGGGGLGRGSGSGLVPGRQV